MIVKRNFDPIKVWQYIKWPMTFTLLWATLVWALHIWDLSVVLNFTPIGVVGSALAIFVAFRNQSAYGRWWEARQIWGGIVNSSRILSRLIITFTDSHAHQENYKPERSEQFKRRMVYRCIAWVNALRLHLRKQDAWEDLRPLLPAEEYAEVVAAQNKPNYLQMLIGRDLYGAMANGTLGGFDSFQMEQQLAALANYQGAAERIKNTPLPRQYDFFTRVFVLVFAALLPFGLLSFFQTNQIVDLSWLIIPFSGLVAGVFIIMERTGAANEDPFENRTTDTPMTALCNTIERDLREVLGEKDLPIKMEAAKGYLF